MGKRLSTINLKFRNIFVIISLCRVQRPAAPAAVGPPPRDTIAGASLRSTAYGDLASGRRVIRDTNLPDA